MTIYRAYVGMTFEPDENGYLEYEDEYGLTAEEILRDFDSKPRTEAEMKTFFADQLWEFIVDYCEYRSIRVEEVK